MIAKETARRIFNCHQQIEEIDKLKQEMQVTTRNMPFDQTPIGDKCAICGKPAKKRIIFGRAY